MAYVAELGYLDGHDHSMVDRDRVIQSIEGMERACFQETNRLVRIRMLGGVAGVRSNAAPLPIAWFVDTRHSWCQHQAASRSSTDAAAMKSKILQFNGRTWQSSG